MSRVLFLYISASSGHQRAAEAIREALALIVPRWDGVCIDTFAYAYPTLGRLLSRTYLEVLRLTPALWDFIYDNPDVETATREARELVNLISGQKLQKLVREHAPAAIVCTQAAPCSVLAAEKRRGKLPIPLLAVVTDFAVHRYWTHKEVDLYCVPSEEVRRALAKQGISASRIAVTGIPISPLFLQRTAKPSLMTRLRLDSQRPTLLIMGGSQGMGPMQELIERLLSLECQMMVLTGLNRALYRTLARRFRRERRVRVFGYTRLVHQLMDAADLLVTKPGGLTSSEALSKGLPMIISNPIPGQEERNADYLIRMGAALRADDPREAAVAVESLLRHPVRHRRMQEKALAIANPYAAIQIAQQVFRLGRQQNEI